MADETKITIENTDEHFTCPADSCILDAGLAAGLHIPHNCRGGACGTCKAQILEGTVDHGWVMSFAITDEEKAEGYCLTCQSKPRAPHLMLRMLEPMRPRLAGEDVIVLADVIAEVVAAHSVTPSIRRLVVAVPPTTRFRFRAGMNMEFLAPGIDQPRPYSMANMPEADGSAPGGQLCFYVTRHPDGRSSGWVHELALGDTVAMRGPYGEFRIPPDAEDAPVLGLAGGSGLSPVLSVIAKALADGRTAPIKLLFSVRDRSEIFAIDTLARLARGHENFSYRVTLTRGAAAPDRWLRGRIPALLEREGSDLFDHVVLIAGAPSFVDDCTMCVVTSGATPERIVMDSFLPRAPAAASAAD